MKPFIKITTTLASLALAGSLHAQGFKTSEFSYLAPTAGSDFDFEPIVTVGDRVPLTGGAPGAEYAFVGIPDAMGIYRDTVSGENILFVAHELGNTTVTTPVPGATALRGAYVSRYVLGGDGGVLSAAVAHSNLFLENTFASNRPPQAGDAVAFTRFCSGSFAGRNQGLDRPMFFTNEETFGAPSYETARGAQSVAIIDGNMHTLPALGRIGRENTIVQPRRDSITAIISTEDAGSPSYVYMYVGQKQRRSSSALDKNGLTGGRVYVLCGRDAQHNEGTFTTGSLPMRWAEIANGGSLTDAQLLAAADLAGAFGFVRVEDAEFDPAQPTRSLFLATTGGSGPNRLGRLYELSMTPTNPVGPCTLNVIYNADEIVTPGGTYTGASVGSLVAVNGGDPARLGAYTGGNIDAGTDFPVSIDNIAVSNQFIMVQEDRNSPADAVFAKYSRNGGLWSLDRASGYQAKLQSTFNYPQIEARDGHSALAAGLWESSGIIATDEIFGAGTFVVNVQAHSQTVNLNGGGTGPSIRTNIPDGLGGFYTRAQARELFAEDGQLIVMRPTP